MTRGRVLPCGLLALGMMVVAGGLQAEPFRILYAEQIELPFERSDAAAARKGRLAPQFALSAYGRQLDLQIEQNTSLTRLLRPETLTGKTVYRGDVAGIDGSWVRLTVIDGETYGAIWDGADLYSIAPGHEVSRYMDAPLPESSGAATFVYRLSDTQGGVESGFCGSSAVENQRGAALQQFRSLLSELKSSAVVQATGDGPLQIEVALLADYEFHGRYADPQAAMLARANVVDGIFDDQLGVAIITTDLTVFNDSANPFTSNDGPGLLTQLSTYRNSTPVIRDRGLAHLFTGKDLAGDTAGIAFIDALCEPAEGVGVTEGWRDATIAALIMAHELGHNFGAPHDGQPGACASAPAAGYIMAPIVSFASSFSGCSIGQMQPRIAAAACITPLKVPDVAVQASAPVQGLVGETFQLAFDVRSVGDAVARNVVAIADVSNFTVESAEIVGGSCAQHVGSGVSCTLDSLEPGESRRVTIRARGSFVQRRDVRLEVFTPNDRNAANNRADTQIILTSAADISITSTPAEVSGLVRTPIAFSVTLDSLGPRSARNVSAQFVLNGLEVLSASTSGGACTPTQSVMTCTFAEIPSGELRRIDVTAQAPIVNAEHYAAVHVTAENDATDNNSYGFPIRVIAERDLAIQIPSEVATAINESVELSFVLRSTGVQASEPGALTLSHSAGAALDIESVVLPGGSCDISSDPVVCSVPAIEAGGTRTVVMRARGLVRRQYAIYAAVSSPQDDAVHNNAGWGLITALHAVDVHLNWRSQRDFFPLTGLPFANTATVRSVGLNTSTNVVVRAVMPSQLAILGAALEGGTCSIDAQIVTCTRAMLARDAEAVFSVEAEARVTGSYTAQVEVSATGDGEASNNQIVWTYFASEGVDVSLDAGAPVALRLGATRAISLTVRNGNARAANPVVELSAPPHVQFLGGVVEDGGCSPNGGSLLRCHLGPDLAANAVRVLETTIRANYVLDFIVNANVTHNHIDVRPGNNTTTFAVTMSDREGDALVEPLSTTVTGQVGQDFAHPRVSIKALATVDDVRVSLSLDPAYASIVSAITDAGACSVSAGVVDCALGTLETSHVRYLTLSVRGVRAGSVSSSVRVTARNDVNAANDAAQIAINLTDPSPPSPPPGQRSGGGGGGGALDPRALFALLALVLLVRTLRVARHCSRAAHIPGEQVLSPQLKGRSHLKARLHLRHTTSIISLIDTTSNAACTILK